MKNFRQYFIIIFHCLGRPISFFPQQQYHFYFIAPLVDFSFLCQAYFIAHPAEYFINCLANIISISLYLWRIFHSFARPISLLTQQNFSLIVWPISFLSHYTSGTFFITLPCPFQSSPLRVLMGDLDCGHMTNV